MPRRYVALLLVIALLASGGCLGTLRHDPMAQEIALAPRDALGLPRRDDRRYWLLRS